MFTILLSILVSTSVLALPTQSNSPLLWSNLKNDKSLARFQSTLLNETLLTFLTDCYSQNVSTTKKLQIPCARYFDAILQLNNTNFIAQQPTITKLFSESTTDKEFCNQTHTYPSMKNYPTEEKDFNDRLVCGYMCIQENRDGDLVPKPICAFLAWMGEQIKNLSKPAGAAIPPVAANVVSSANNSSHTVALNAPPSKEAEKPAGVEAAKKPDLPNQAANIQSNISAQTSKKDDEVKQVQSIPKPNPVSTEQKQNSVVAVVPPAAVPDDKVEKPQTIITKEDQEDPPPTLGADTQEEETLLSTNQGKHDSVPNNHQANVNDQANENDSDVDPEDINPEDDDTDEFELRNENLKPKDPPLAIPEDDDAGHKGNQDVIDRNYLNYVPNTNHVTDPFLEESGSNFFTYFLIGMFMCIILYVVYHNKSKILALLLEGRRGDKGRGGRRKHTAAYRKLDSNLEEAITSSASGRTTQIIY